MLSNLLLLLGCIALTAAFRRCESQHLQRLGNLGILLTSYLLGWKLTGHHAVGILAGLSWLLFPWIDIVTRVRNTPVPSDQPLRSQAPPGPYRFPSLNEVSEEIEAEGFEHVEDTGWDHHEDRQFLRLFVQPVSKMRATVNLVESENISFFYVTLCTKSSDGILWCSWNYPFSSSLKQAPHWRIQRVRHAQNFHQLLSAHQRWLRQSQAAPALAFQNSPEELTAEIQADLHAQLEHNLRCGILQRRADNAIHYSWRGCIFLWLQFLRDMLRT
ncbi:MAG: hypothetical protein RLZZ142_21 [Verrucomicrobiota bacterium]|jgi:hypothetical protein